MEDETEDGNTKITPVHSPEVELEAPPSKAFTLRGLFLAALADGSSVLRNGLHADDQKHAARALSTFGPDLQYDDGDYVIMGTGGKLTAPDEIVYTGDSGVTTRFLIPVAALAKGRTKIDGSKQIRSRPIGDLVDAMREAGVKIETENGGFPVTVTGKSFASDRTSIAGSRSSQFLSGLLIAAPYIGPRFRIDLKDELRSRPYIDITIDCMNRFGVDVERSGYHYFEVPPDQRYRPIEYRVEGDYTSASYFFAAAAVTEGDVRITNLNPDSTQGDRAILSYLEQMGCRISRGPNFVDLEGPEELRPIQVDMSNHPDLVPTVAAVAAFARGETIISNVDHLRYKESNRIKSISVNLNSCGINAEPTENGLRINGGNPEGGTIDPADDHRIAMAFSILGLGGEEVIVKNASVVNKSFPGFFDLLKKFQEHE